MSMETGISMYFWDHRISIRKQALLDLGNPQYIHLLINKSKKYLFIQRCEERDNDTFPIQYREDTEEIDRYYINAKNLMEYGNLVWRRRSHRDISTGGGIRSSRRRLRLLGKQSGLGAKQKRRKGKLYLIKDLFAVPCA